MNEIDQKRLDELKTDIDNTQQSFWNTKGALDKFLRRYSDRPEPAIDLLTCADEFGVDHVLNLIRDNPKSLHLKPTATAAKAELAPLIEQLHDAARDLDALTAERETIFEAHNPAHERVYNFYGRECRLDHKNLTLVYLDQPAMAYELALTEHPNRMAPSPDLRPDREPSDAPQKTRRRNRTRTM